MLVNHNWRVAFFFCVLSGLLSSCANRSASSASSSQDDEAPYSASYDESKYSQILPQQIDTREKVIVVDPTKFAWGAYGADGRLVRAGIATAGADYCPDDGGPCRSTIGSFRIYSMGDVDCASRTYPRPVGGALMPYCMFYHNGESLHGSPDKMLVEQNVSHGCIHIRIPDAQWLRDDFASVGTKVIVRAY